MKNYNTFVYFWAEVSSEYYSSANAVPCSWSDMTEHYELCLELFSYLSPSLRSELIIDHGHRTKYIKYLSCLLFLYYINWS